MAHLREAAPYFPVPDVAAAVAHYESCFGFSPRYVAGRPPVFAIVARDGLSLMFRLVSDPGRICPNELQGGTWDVFYWVDDADALYAELTGRGASTAYPPIDRAEYGMREFAMRDTFGYVLGFGHRLATERP